MGTNSGPLWYGPGRRAIGLYKGISRSMDVMSLIRTGGLGVERTCLLNAFPSDHWRKWTYAWWSMVNPFWVHVWLTIKIRLDSAKTNEEEGVTGSGREGEWSEGQGKFGGAGRGEVTTRAPDVPLSWSLIQAMAQRMQFIQRMELQEASLGLNQKQEGAWVLRTRNR